mmetsp:Transcript_40233/g.94200  ORF Transcript_40233/g.94200 Transcript_40233/m.94200 type:complete len:217 (-) Transcript_40233:1313-1963(-)
MRRRRNPPGLRVPLREDRVRRGVPHQRNRLRGTDGRESELVWGQDRGEGAGPQVPGSGGPGHARSHRQPRRCAQVHQQRRRIPSDHQGELRRRGARDARRQLGEGARRELCARDQRGALGVRGRDCLHREVCQEPKAHRGAGHWGWHRQCRPPLHARLFRPAPPPEGPRDRARLPPAGGHSPPALRGLAEHVPRGSVQERGDRRVPGGSARQPLLH